MNSRSALLAALVLVAFGTTSAAQDLAPVSSATPVAPLSRPVKGLLVGLDGLSPRPGRPVRVIDARDGRPVAEAVTASDGSFELGTLGVGKYLLETSGLSQPIEVRADQPLKSLKILIPGGEEPPIVMSDLKPSGTRQVAETFQSVLFWTGVGSAVVIAGVGGAVIGYQESGPFHDDPDLFVTRPPDPVITFEAFPSGDYGQAPLGGTAPRQFILRNLSATDTVAGTIQLNGSSQFSLQGPTSFNLGPGATVQITVNFSPTVEGTHNATLSATATSPQSAQGQTVSRVLTGRGVHPDAFTPTFP